MSWVNPRTTGNAVRLLVTYLPQLEGFTFSRRAGFRYKTPRLLIQFKGLHRAINKCLPAGFRHEGDGQGTGIGRTGVTTDNRIARWAQTGRQLTSHRTHERDLIRLYRSKGWKPLAGAFPVYNLRSGIATRIDHILYDAKADELILVELKCGYHGRFDVRQYPDQLLFYDGNTVAVRLPASIATVACLQLAWSALQFQRMFPGVKFRCLLVHMDGEGSPDLRNVYFDHTQLVAIARRLGESIAVGKSHKRT